MDTKKTGFILPVLNTIGFTAVVVINALANILPINGKNTGALSDAYPNLFVPAGLTFAIWGVIYLSLLAFSVYQFLSIFSKNDAEAHFIKKIGIFFVLSCAANIGWIFAWHYEQVFLSLVIMLLLLASLLTVYLKLGTGTKPVSKREKFLVHVPFSLYLGWITIATIANVTAVLVNMGWDGFGLSPVFWTIAMIIAGTLITLAVVFTRNDLIYGGVVVWAFAGIFIKRINLGYDNFAAIIITVVICAVLILVGGGIRFRKWLST
ncbi:MAG: tryptophan-rich sensory protein [Spirochaetales bacterium]|nr:tryptophan-rich sensory protein [Spirochaetales bacterium]